MNEFHSILQKEATHNRRGRLPLFLLGGISFLCGFLPDFTITVSDAVYSVSGFTLLTTQGLFTQAGVLAVPTALRLTLAGSIVFLFVGFLLLFWQLPRWTATCYFLAAVLALGSFLFSADFSESANQLSFGDLTLTWKLPMICLFGLSLLTGFWVLLQLGKEQVAQAVFFLSAFVSVGAVMMITLYLIIAGLPAWNQIGVFSFLFGDEWNPEAGIYGIFPMILSTIVAALGAILLGVPVGILTALFLVGPAPKKLVAVIRPAVQLLAGIPSVVYGCFGMLTILPMIRRLFPASVGDSLLAVIVILSIMVLPTIISVSENALRVVPTSYRDAGLALGAPPMRVLFGITLPAARSGVLSGVVLGVGRAIGETMAVLMVAGNVVNFPSLFSSVRLLTTGIVLEMSYSSGLHRQALFAIGLVLFVFIMLVNGSFLFLTRKGAKQLNGKE